jgi:hypothetical protein
MAIFCYCGTQIEDEFEACCNDCFDIYSDEHGIAFILENSEAFFQHIGTIKAFCKEDKQAFITFLKAKKVLEQPYEDDLMQQAFWNEVDHRVDMYRDDGIPL